MKRLIVMASLLLLGAFSFGLYMLENKVEHMQRRLADLDRQLLQEQESVQVLKAEWSFLNQPERLQQLAVRYVDRVGLKPIAPEQTGSLKDLPARASGSDDTDGGSAPAMPRPAFKPTPPAGVVLVRVGSKR